jgi:hypothetical protein
MTDFASLLRALTTEGVDFIVVGGAAAVAHGSARLTLDLDVVYSRSLDNLERLSRSLLPYDPYLRGMPPGLPFTLDAKALRNGMNFTLTTSLGAIDLLGEITGGGGYDDLLPHTIRLDLFGLSCLCLDLDRLIFVKRAAGRPKDIEAVAELEALRDEESG